MHAAETPAGFTNVKQQDDFEWFFSHTAADNVDITAPHPESFDSELDFNLAAVDGNQFLLFALETESAYDYTLLRSEETTGPLSEITHSAASDSWYSLSESAQNRSTSLYSGYTPSIGAPSVTDFQEFEHAASEYSSVMESSKSVSPKLTNNSLFSSIDGSLSELFSTASADLSKLLDCGNSELLPSAFDDVAARGHTAAQPPAAPGVTMTNSGKNGPRKKYQCHICNHASTRPSNLKAHMETHNPHRAKPFACHYHLCERAFTRKNDLGRHLAQVHGDKDVSFARRANSAKKSSSGSPSAVERSNEDLFDFNLTLDLSGAV